MLYSQIPQPQGLYDPAAESDSCGVAFVVDVRGRRSHDVVTDGLRALVNLEHRGAVGSDPDSGDGAGILLQLPVALLTAVAGVVLPPPDPSGENTFAAGICFLPPDRAARSAAVARIEALAAQEHLDVLGWRDVPVDPDGAKIGSEARACMPHLSQLVVAAPPGPDGRRPSGLHLDRLVYPLRKRAEQPPDDPALGVYFPSLSARTIVYKGMLTATQLPGFFPDLRDPRCVSAIAVVHSRFATNTFPAWPLAQPLRYLAHNGEINTIRGNRNRMRAREAMLGTDLIPGDLDRLSPICTPDASDSASLDEVFELLHLGGRGVDHVASMMIPPAWENDPAMAPRVRDYHRYHGCLMEPWDGPACVTFTDGVRVGAVLDRNGLRPGRWWRTTGDRVVFASETGVLDVAPSEVVAKGRLEPGRMLLVDTVAGRIVPDGEIKAVLAAAQPYSRWLGAGQVCLADLPVHPSADPPRESLVRRQREFGYTEEDLRLLLGPMAAAGREPIGSMGDDTAPAVLSTRPRLLYDYFVELFAQVTNPPLDAIREEIVTSLARVIGPEGNLLAPTADSCRQIVLPWPVLGNTDLARLAHLGADGDHLDLAGTVLDAVYDVDGGGAALAAAIEDLRARASAAIAAGYRVLVLSDRAGDDGRAPIPSLLAVSAVHHHLIRTRERMRAALVVESGDAREVHHVALLIGFGAAAVNPYLALDTVDDLAARGEVTGVEPAAAVRGYLHALGTGVLKVMSKMGISTVGSYTAAQCFEAIGLDRGVVDEYFTGTTSTLGGVGLDVLARDVGARHRSAFAVTATDPAYRLDAGGMYRYRRDGELHLFTPETVFALQHATRTGRREVFAHYSTQVNTLAERGGTLRGLFRITEAVQPVPLDEVESVDAIVARFGTGAMSYGSISREAHETMAVAMNRLGGRSNTGEGGEDTDRLHDPVRRSAVKQVASGRFGVTSDYLVCADDIQIKIAQGAKPGEGGQLPAFKVSPDIAATRHCTPGVGLISPPPHHDIYSIEDLAQLIHDLTCANDRARIHVKLVSSVGVGTVAAGVAKARADVVLISGHDGGTGAAPLTSLVHAGTPWEIGLAATQQTLVLGGLRDRITVQCDGGLRTGRDVLVAALLGAEEYGFSTAPLVVAGCVMMRVCHLDTCPVGIATQDPVLRHRYTGRPEFVERYFRFVAEEVRDHLARLGLRSLDDAIGRADLLDTADALAHWKSRGLDLTPIFAVPTGRDGRPLPKRRRVRGQDHGLDRVLDRSLIRLAARALDDGRPVRLRTPVRNVDRTVGTLLGAEVTRRHGAAGLPDDTVVVELTGSAGQSLGAFLPAGITLDVVGDANDYVGKGLSGGRIVVRPAPDAPFDARDQVIVGNTVLYGATSGEMYLRGRAGERFAVRNSGAVAVVEGVGDHACEYMTGGTVVILGAAGRNLAAGMSGGLAYLLDPDPARVNDATVTLEPLDGDDRDRLHAAVTAHLRRTGSPVAASILGDWPASSRRFTTVLPVDYRRVLEASRLARAHGRDVDTAIMEAAGG